MEQTIKIKLLECIGKVYEQSKDCKLETAFFETVENELKLLSRELFYNFIAFQPITILYLSPIYKRQKQLLWTCFGVGIWRYSD